MKKIIFLNIEENMKNVADLWGFDLGLNRQPIFRKANKLIGRLRLYNLSYIITLTVRPRF